MFNRPQREFQAAVAAVVEDGKYSAEEREYLSQVGGRLGLRNEDANKIFHEEVERFMRRRFVDTQYFNLKAADALIQLLGRDIKEFGVTWKELKRRLHKDISEYLARVLAEQLRDHFLSESELASFEDLCRRFGTAFDSIKGKFTSSVVSELEQYLQMQFASGDIGPRDKEYVERIAARFALPFQTRVRLGQLAERFQLLHSIQAGNLPTVEGPAYLDGHEVCHWREHGSELCQVTSAGRVKNLFGETILTNTKLYFVEDGGKVRSVPLAKIVSVVPNQSGLQVSCSGSAAGLWLTRDPGLLFEVADAAIAFAKRLRVRVDAESGSRHIPQQVKTEVWKRDCGRCTQCGAIDYLEFDHIIPVAKGGANSVKNVQLLCRRCNGLKSDRI